MHRAAETPVTDMRLELLISTPVTVFVSKNNSLTICQQVHVGVILRREECLYGCYVHSSIIPTFHRRCYWLLQAVYCRPSVLTGNHKNDDSRVSKASVPDSLCTICYVHMRFAGSSLSTAEQQGDWSSQSGNRERSPVSEKCKYSAIQWPQSRRDRDENSSYYTAQTRREHRGQRG
ncbi:hypothetical protein PAMA_021458 [Pampus argenteus]